MTHTNVPKTVLNDIEKLCRSFLWDRDATHKGLHYVSWEGVSRPRRKGGLGFHASSNWIGPLRSRIAWDFCSKPMELFQRCMRHKYGDKPWDHDFKRGQSISWKIICDGVRCLSSSVRWRIGNGHDIDVLYDVWRWERAFSVWPPFVMLLLLKI
ncbi:hypothetical protein KFK09_003898 [Dendrobium nobile]|uniref:Uncharacterized protein n=1 Tax=Dendrobium nobile TaxID=94219 RepID=A0A8T3C1G2_DENNO|nr:hypothetical protein KFK09_003898 [Dendrobium nobile]